MPRNGGRYHNDTHQLKTNTKYRKRGHQLGRPDNNRRVTIDDDLSSLMDSLNEPRGNNEAGNRMAIRPGQKLYNRQGRKAKQFVVENQLGWWRITIKDASFIGKDLVMSTLKAHCPRQFQPYHVRSELTLEMHLIINMNYLVFY
jgi:hypothetical protein